MGFFRNMSVKSKLLSLCLVAAVGLVFMCRSSFVAMEESKSNMDKMFKENVRALYAIGSCRHAMRYMQGMMLIATSSNDPQRIKDVISKYNAGKKEIEENWAAFEEIAKNKPELTEATKTAKADLEIYTKALDEAIRLAGAGDGHAGRDHYDKAGAKVATALGKHLTELSSLTDNAAEEINRLNEEKMDSAAYASLAYGVAIVVMLIIASLFVTREITTPLSILMGSCEKMRDGDFRKPAEASAFEGRMDEYGQMQTLFAAMRENIRALMGKIAASADELSTSAQALTDSASQSAQASDQVAHSVTNAAGAVVEQQQNVADTMESVDICLDAIGRLTSEARDVASNANQSEQNAQDGAKAIEESVATIMGLEKIVNHSAETVDKLGQSSEEIGTIVEAISSIAEQTNLLALNAAIEAARAGEHGRGFAVVADEVRKLAEESQNAAAKITNLINIIQSDTSEAVESMREGSKAVKDGTRSVEALRDTFDQIRVSSGDVAGRVRDMTSDLSGVSAEAGKIKEKSEQISDSGGKVSTEMETVSAASEEQSASSNEIANASDSLAHLAADLQESLRRYRF